MNNLPLYISIAFVLTTLLAVFIFYKAARNSGYFLFLVLGWMVLQTVVSMTGFYTVTDTIPPRFLFLILPPLLVIVLLFATKRGRQFLGMLDLKMLTLLHIVRIPVELVLFGLFIYKMIPELMTFEGRNMDIISGITAPVLFYLAFLNRRVHRGLLLAWNFICLLLLVNIVTIAILSAPFPFQKFAFSQPNIAVLHFPFVWLPAVVVPLVLLSHLAAIRSLVVGKGKFSNTFFAAPLRS